MIRYRCGSCGQKIRAKEDAIGKMARCPSCSHRDRVPSPVVPNTVPVVKPSPPAEDERESIVEDFAPAAPPPREEEEHESIVEVPATSAPSSKTEPIRYRCGSCQLKLRAPAESAGRSARCPRCKRAVPVPSPSGTEPKPASTRAAPPEDEIHDSILEHPAPHQPDVPPIRYQCSHCQLRLRAPASAAGKNSRCPKCQKPVPVPRPTLPMRPVMVGGFVPPGYEVLGELGKGAFGVVYKARQLKLDRVVALKVMRSDVDAALIPRFRGEATAVARMQHNNIVQIFEVGEHEGRVYCVLEYVDGGSLQEMLRGQPLPPRQAAQLVQDLALAIHYAHQQGVVHRDVKPANILFSRKRAAATRTPADEGASVLLMAGTLKITDFGLAKKLDDDSCETKAGALIGTPSYMAPEQAEGKEVGPAADVYALGAVLYEMLTGKPPFIGINVYETIHKVCFHEPVPPGKTNKNVPKDLETICLKCLEKNPARRYDSASELAADLGRFRSGDSIQARPASVVMRSVRMVRRRPAPVLAALLLLAIGAGGAVGWKFYSDAAQVKQDAKAIEDKRREDEEAVKRIDVAHYASLVSRRGVNEGFGAPLSDEEVKRRNFSFRLSTNHKKQVVKVEAIDGQGKPTTNHNQGVLIDDDFGTDRRTRETSWEFEFRKDGTVEREVGKDRNGEVLWTFVHLGGGTAVFQNAAGVPQPRSPAGAAFADLEYDENGFLKKAAYFDRTDQTTGKQARPSASRVFGHRFEANAKGLVEKIVCLDADGRRMVNKSGIAIARFEFDDRGNRTKGRFFDVDDKPTTYKGAGHGYVGKYDAETGNLVEEVVLGLDGKPGPDENGVARQKVTYDGDGRASSFEFFDRHDKRCVSRQLGGAIVRVRHDGDGNVSEYRVFGTDGRPGVHPDGYSWSKNEYTAKGHLARMSYFDRDDKKCLVKENYHSFEVVGHDRFGNYAKVRHFGLDGKPCLTTDGYFERRAKHDDKGQLVREDYFDAEEKPCLHRDGYAAWSVDYDGRGNRVKEAFYDAGGKLRAEGANTHFTQQRSRFAYFQAGHDEYGNRTEKAFYDADKRRHREDGYHRAETRYDRYGNPIEEKYFDQEDERCKHAEGHAGWRAKYEKGKQVEFTYYGLDNKPHLHAGHRYAGWKAKYDARGFLSETAFFDAEGRRCLERDGYSKAEVVCDDRGKHLEERFFGVEDEPKAVKDGYAVKRARYNDRGLFEELTYFDVKGQKCLHKEGNWRYQVWYDERGNRAKYAYFDTDDKPVVTTSHFSYALEKHDALGRLEEVALFDADDRPCVGKDRYAVKRLRYDRSHVAEESYFDRKGNPTRAKGGFATVKLEYNEFGQRVRGAYFAGKDRLTDANDGFAVWTAKYDPKTKNLVEVATLRADGKYYPTAEGFALFQLTYDDKNLPKTLEFYDVDDTGRFPAESARHGCHKMVMENDDRGNRVAEEYYGKGGGPKPGREGFQRTEKEYTTSNELRQERRTGYPAGTGFAAKVLKYDKGGRIRELSLLDGEEQVLGKIKASYDRRGNLTETALVDGKNNPARNKLGWDRVRMSYGLKNEMLEKTESGFDPERFGYAAKRTKFNDRGKEVELAYLDAKGRPAQDRAGIHAYEASYDERDNLTGEAYKNSNGALTAGEKGYATARFLYEDDRKTEEKYFNADERPCPNRDGFARLAMKYDDKGNLKEVAKYGPDSFDLLRAGPDGVALVRIGYGEARGRPTSQEYFGPDEKPVVVKGRTRWEQTFSFGRQLPRGDGAERGYVGWRRRFAANGQLQWEETFGHDGKDGYAARRVTYDDERVGEVAYFDGGGKPAVSDKSGVHRLTNEYDAEGNHVGRKHFAKGGERCKDKDGVSGWRARYDTPKQPLWVTTTFVDEKDRPTVSLEAKYATVKRELDLQRVPTGVTTYLDANGGALRSGVFVAKVEGAGRLAALEFRKGDRIVKYNGKEVTCRDALMAALRADKRERSPREIEVERSAQGKPVRRPAGFVPAVLLAALADPEQTLEDRILGPAKKP